MLSSSQYALLQSELNTDPGARGYAALISLGNDSGLADLLNAPDTNAANDQFDRITSHDIFEAIDATEFSALAQAALLRLLIILVQLGQGSIDVRGSNIRALLAAIFPVGGPTRAALLAASKRHTTRAEQVLGVLGVIITATDVAIALRGV